MVGNVTQVDLSLCDSGTKSIIIYLCKVGGEGVGGVSWSALSF